MVGVRRKEGTCCSANGNEETMRIIVYMALIVNSFLYFYGLFKSLMMLYYGFLVLIALSRLSRPKLVARSQAEEKTGDSPISQPGLPAYDGKQHATDRDNQTCGQQSRQTQSLEYSVQPSQIYDYQTCQGDVLIDQVIYQEPAYDDATVGANQTLQHGVYHDHLHQPEQVFGDADEQVPDDGFDFVEPCHELISDSKRDNVRSLNIYSNYLNERQTESTLERKIEIKDKLVKILSKGLLRRVDLHIVGSSANGFGSDECGLDLCLTQDPSAEKMSKFVIFDDLQKCLECEESVKDLKRTSYRMTLLTFNFDLMLVSINVNKNSIKNTKLMLYYSQCK